MITNLGTKLFLCVLVLLFSGQCRAQQIDNSSECSTVYENHNQSDYGPLKLLVVEGTSVVQGGTQEQPGVPGACFVLFTEKDHTLITSVKADNKARFEFKNVPPGHYRLVARAKGLCTANIPIDVLKSSGRRKTLILVHFRPAGIDTCSYGELTNAKARQ
jgi:hypothetical protein